MNGDIMELTQIEYFLEVAHSEHMTKSAEKLHIAQPALTQAIRRLEAELGVPLFEKRGRNIVLTEYGRYLKEQLEPVKARLDFLPEALQKMKNEKNETIYLNVLAASTIITDAVVEFESSHSNIKFKLVQAEQIDVSDIEITTVPSDKEISDSENQFVIEEKIFLAVPNDRFENYEKIELADVENEQFISLMGSKQFRYICDRICRKAGVNPKISFESDSPTAVKNMISVNLGIGFWPEFTWGSVNNKKVKLIEINNSNCSRNIVFTCKKERLENKNVSEFFEFLKEYCERQRLNNELE